MHFYYMEFRRPGRQLLLDLDVSKTHILASKNGKAVVDELRKRANNLADKIADVITFL